jgi:two-component system, response regulator YesN
LPVLSHCHYTSSRLPPRGMCKTTTHLSRANSKFYHGLLGLFNVLVEYIMSRHLIHIHQDTVVGELLAYIESRLDQPIALTEAAAAVYRSTSSVSHLCQKHLGTTFKRLVAELRVAHAEERMRTIPGITVKEAAYAVGYDDPAYFSRVYRSVRGRPPSAFLKNLKL